MNMVNFAREESATLPLEREYDKWLKKLCKIVGDLEDDDLAYALWEDGCAPEDAAHELTEAA
ncbi:hypothetical protein [Alcaligenes sp. CHO6]|uniref:hypothetical protein n=1 Tax=Alcaligenes sp. CHO6 TaxID=3123298 RepID=UPI003014D2CB